MKSGESKRKSYPAWMNIIRSNRRVVLWVQKILIVFMMGSLSTALMYLGRRLAPSWNGDYLPWLCMAVAVEAIISRSVTSDRSGRDKWIYIASELLLIAILVKILLYVMRGLDQILSDIPRWQQGFETFFEGEYFFILFPIFIIWLLSGQFSGMLEYLHSDDEDFFAEELGIVGHLERDRLNTRQRVTELLFLNGVMIVFLTALARVRTPEGWGIPDAVQAPVLNVILYFVMTLILLGMTQFSLLQGRWLWQRVPVSPGLGANWIRYTLVFFLVLGVVAAILPHRFTEAIFAPLNMLFGYIVSFFMFLMTLALMPLAYLSSLLSGCNQTQGPSPVENIEPPRLIQPEPSQPIPWLELLRMILFWLVFLAVIIAAVRYYLISNRAQLKSLRRFRPLNWLANILSAIWNWLRGVNQQLAAAISDGLQRLRPARTFSSTHSPHRINYRNLTPRQKVIFLYLSLLKRSSERGVGRKPAQTPTQFEGALDEAIPDAEMEVHTMTEAFQEARYSPHPVEDDQVNNTQSVLRRIIKALQNKKNAGTNPSSPASFEKN